LIQFLISSKFHNSKLTCKKKLTSVSYPIPQLIQFLISFKKNPIFSYLFSDEQRGTRPHQFAEWWRLFTHEMNIDWKPLLEIAGTGQSGFRNRMARFCCDRRQLGAPPGFNEVLLLWPSGVWMVESREP
jgi:hypothetical protein